MDATCVTYEGDEKCKRLVVKTERKRHQSKQEGGGDWI